ncbi:MAG TPA: ImcF-related family protein [Gemmatimonadaceae bacterium]|nr:ImcF-related family protein [Gemmatimonadaceae bacterium]
MTRKARIWLVAAAIFVAFVIVAWFLGSALALRGSDLWVFRIGLWVLGLVAAGVILWFFLHDSSTPPSTVKADDVDGTAAAARAALAGSRVAGKKTTLSRLPMVLVLGGEGSAKTTTVVRSGLEPELLAGGVFAGETVAPTRGINVWFSNGTAFLEAGGPLVADGARFARVLRHLQPRRASAVFGGGAQPPRVAMVCVSCEELMRPGASESALHLARTLRSRLAEVSRSLGIRLPVYVVFTKADRIPHFADYVQNLSTDEARQVLGVTLPADAGVAGQYADRETRRVTEAFQRLFLSLADKRLQFLARENAPERKPGEYEFPREFRKLAPLAVQFLVELGKPSQLQVSPFLRGFYFAGVRAVIVTEQAQAMAPQAPAARAAAGMAATGVFNPAQFAVAAQAAAPAAPTVRKVPQWVFLQRLFGDVVLADRAAMAVTRGGSRVNLLRRALFATVIVLAVAAGTVLTVSYLGNRRLQRDTIAAARSLAALPTAGREIPPVEALSRLDSLRSRLEVLGRYEREGAPLHLRWGLYAGSALYPEARRVYFAGFDKLLFGGTREAIAGTLRTLPDAPGATDDYGTTYDLLKAYLIATTFPAKSTADFMTPVLMRGWIGGRTVDSLHTQLAQQQFAFYANELRFGNPYALQQDVGTVTHARSYLNKFAGVERIYQYMLSEAAKANPPVQFNRKYPGSAAYVVDSYEVPGAFTKGGYTYMQGAFKNADRFFQGESWVLGDQAAGQMDKEKALAELRARYQADFVRHWRTYLQSAAVARYANVKDAAKKLSVLAGNQSPLLELFALAAQHTAVDTSSTGAALQPVQVVTPASLTDKLVGPSNQEYMTALAQLQAAMDQVANAPVGGADAAVAQTTTSASMAKVAAQKMAQQFRVVGDGAVSATALRLLQDPIAYAEPLVRNFGAGELNGKGAAFCAAAAPVLAKYPFDPSATEQATPAEVAAIFRPGTGTLWTYYGEALQNVIVKQGDEYVAKPGGSPAISPAFLGFFNRAAGVSDALFKDGGTEPRLTFTLKPVLTQGVSDLSVTVEGQTMSFSNKKPETRQFSWTGAATGNAEMAAEIGKTDFKVLAYQGPWAVFQMFNQADRWQSMGNVHTVEWVVRTGGQPMTLKDGTQVKVAFEVNLGGGPPVLRKDYFSGLRCVKTVVK